VTKQQVPTDGILNGAVTGPKLAIPLVIAGTIEQQQISTPANPPAGWMRMYPKTDDKFYYKSSSGVEKPMGAEDPLTLSTLIMNTGGRIKGDFSNATQSSRTSFQTNTANTFTVVNIIPNGTGSTTALSVYNSSTPDNATFLQLRADPTVVSLTTGVTGTGAFLPITFNAYNQERGRMDTISTNWQAPQDLRLNSGVSYDGAAWNRVDTSSPLSHINVGRGTFNFYNAIAGSGAPAWVNRLSITAAGVVTVGGAFTTTGDVNAYYLQTSDGSNGVVKSGAGSLYVRGANGTVYIDGAAGLHVNGGQLTVAGTLTASGHVQGNSTISATGRVHLSGGNTSVIGTGTPNLGSLELQPSGGGASMISFHRPGAFAAYFGVDTDNQWKVGGWSMGAASYRIVHEGIANPTIIDPSWRGNTGFTIPTTNDLTNYMFWYGTGNVTLPTAVAGKIRFIKAWGGAATVYSAGGTNMMPPGSQGSIVSSFVLNYGDSVSMISDGTYWWTV
jgi:hypothetical protein